MICCRIPLLIKGRHRLDRRKRMTEENGRGISFKSTLKYFLCGILIGGGGILPGVSGGVLCVLFGIYRPMMALLAHPFGTLKKSYGMFIPLILGGAAGFVLFANVLKALFGKYELLATWAFIGLIAGAIPSMLKDAGKTGRSKRDIFAMAAAFVVVLAAMLIIRFCGFAGGIEPNIWWFLFCGAAWGLSIVIPGMTSSTLLMSMGLYMPMTAGIATLDPAVIIPWGIGLGVTILVSARAVNNFFENHYSTAGHCTAGIVAAFTIAIIPGGFSGGKQAALSMLLLVLGFAAAYLMNGFNIERE